jgi:hypothetical protein
MGERLIALRIDSAQSLEVLEVWKAHKLATGLTGQEQRMS